MRASTLRYATVFFVLATAFMCSGPCLLQLFVPLEPYLQDCE